MRKLFKVILAVVLVYGLLLGAFFSSMHLKPASFTKVMAKTPSLVFMIFPFRLLWLNARAGRLNSGDEAPDFELETYDQKSKIRLSSFRGKKPVVLVFGSYT